LIDRVTQAVVNNGDRGDFRQVANLIEPDAGVAGKPWKQQKWRRIRAHRVAAIGCAGSLPNSGR
jgi:hypothetical protein